MKTAMRIQSTFLLICGLLLSSWGGQAAADNFAETINTQAATAGHQVIYEMNVGSFTQDGTLAKAAERLGELKRLGVDIVWLMPVFPRGGGINSPYAATDFRAVNPAYGTVADLKDFVDEAHRNGMKVWLDWVPNHTATDATWVSTHPEYYEQSGGSFVHPNNYGDVYQLDYDNPDLVEAMNGCLTYWVDETDIDGYRCDYVSSGEIPASYWISTIQMLKTHKEGKEITMLAEADLSDVRRLLPCGFDYDYAWGFQGKLEQYGAGVYTAPLKVHVNNLLDASRELGVSRMLYLTNHDQNWNYDKQTLTQKYGANKYLLTVLTFTLWGMPMIYNGQETGGDQALNYFTDTKVDWNVSDDKMRNTICTLAALKHSQQALADGSASADNASVEILTTSPASSVLAYRRQAGTSEVVVILNTAATNQTATVEGLEGTYSLWLNSEDIAEGISRHNLSTSGTLTVSIESKGYRVLVKGEWPEEDISTAIQALSDVDQSISDDNRVYNLMGQIISPDTRGLQISNGKKYLHY